RARRRAVVSVADGRGRRGRPPSGAPERGPVDAAGGGSGPRRRRRRGATHRRRRRRSRRVVARVGRRWARRSGGLRRPDCIRGTRAGSADGAARGSGAGGGACRVAGRETFTTRGEGGTLGGGKEPRGPP